MSTLWIRASYGVLLAVVTALTVGFGVFMIATGPKAPDTPSLTFQQLQNVGDNQQDTDRVIKTVDRFYQDAYDYRREYPSFQRNALVAFVLLAVLFGAGGVALPPAFNTIRFGLTLGAAMLMLYAIQFALGPVPNPAPASSASITNLLAAGSPPGLDFAGRFLRFAASFVALLICVFVGLWRFVEWGPAERSQSTQAPDDQKFPEPVRAEPATTTQPPEQFQWKRPESE